MFASIRQRVAWKWAEYAEAGKQAARSSQLVIEEVRRSSTSHLTYLQYLPDPRHCPWERGETRVFHMQVPK